MEAARIWNQVNWDLRQVSSLQLFMILTQSLSLPYLVSYLEIWAYNTYLTGLL